MDLLETILADLNTVKDSKTQTYRDIAKAYKKKLNALPMRSVYDLCEALLKQRHHPTTIIAYQMIFDQNQRYDENTYLIFEDWTFKYIRDWWDCDDFMTHAFQTLIMRYPEKIKQLKSWVHHDQFAVRRSAAVILIVPAKKGLLESKIIFEICDLLRDDPHYLVQKGFGWLLKESSVQYHDAVIAYLKEHVHQMTRTAFRYALEKLPKAEKDCLMKL